IEIEDGIEIQDATFDDITENPHDFNFDNNTAPELLVSMYENNEAPAVIINANFAIDADLNPVDDSIVVEDGNSPYANLIAVRSGDEERPELKRLIEVLQSDEIKTFIEENYNRSEEHTSELQSRFDLVCRLLLEKKKKRKR